MEKMFDFLSKSLSARLQSKIRTKEIFDNPKLQKSFEDFCKAAEKAPIQDQQKLIRKLMRD